MLQAPGHWVHKVWLNTTKTTDILPSVKIDDGGKATKLAAAQRVLSNSTLNLNQGQTSSHAGESYFGAFAARCITRPALIVAELGDTSQTTGRGEKWVIWQSAIQVELSQASISITWLFGPGAHRRGPTEEPSHGFAGRQGGSERPQLNREGSAEFGLSHWANLREPCCVNKTPRPSTALG